MRSPVWGNKEFPVTSPFGMRNGVLHDGVDIGMGDNTPLYAIKDGNCQSQVGNYGEKYQYITYQDGSADLLVHLNTFVKSGLVKKGELISYSGHTGKIPGTNIQVAPHLHFTHRTKGPIPSTAVDPTSYLIGGVNMTDPVILAKDAEIANLKKAIASKDAEIGTLKATNASLADQIAILQKQTSSMTSTGATTPTFTLGFAIMLQALSNLLGKKVI